MNHSVRVFQSIQKYFAITGITSHQSIQRHPFNGRNLMVLLMSGMATASHCIYFLFIASSFIEYLTSAFWAFIMFYGFLIFANTIWKMTILFKYINRFNYIIEESK